MENRQKNLAIIVILLLILLGIVWGIRHWMTSSQQPMTNPNPNPTTTQRKTKSPRIASSSTNSGVNGSHSGNPSSATGEIGPLTSDAAAAVSPEAMGFAADDTSLVGGFGSRDSLLDSVTISLTEVSNVRWNKSRWYAVTF